MFNLEKALKGWLRAFQKHRAYDEAALEEMDLHIRDHIEDLIGEGLSEEDAFKQAVSSFGEVPKIAEEEYWNQKRKRTLRTMLFTTLFKNYSKTAVRSMMRNPLSSLINIVGLSAAIGICIFTYSFAQWTYRTDQFHENKHEVFLATFYSQRDGKLLQNGRSPQALAKKLEQDFPQLKAVCRMENLGAVVKYEDRVFQQRITLADPDFLSMFTFPLVKGNSNSLKGVNNVILSEEIAKKYFGDEDPMGQTLLLKFGEERSKSFLVTGVAKDFPASISFNFHFLIHFDNMDLADPSYNDKNWTAFAEATFLQLKDPSAAKSIADQMGEYKALQNEEKQDWQIESFALEPISTLHRKSSNIRDSFIYGSQENYVAIVFLSLVGIFMLALACFNYINIAIVSASKRLKEIGIRKTIGANKSIIILQFLGENLIATSLALLLGVLLGAYVFIPWFESLFFFDMGFTWLDTTLWIYLPIVLFITAIASGLYPAFYVSKFPVTGILKGSVKFGKRNVLTRVILGFQVVLSCMFITFAIMFTQNSSYLANRSWGYNENQSLYAQVSDLSSFRQLESTLLQNTDVLSIAGSANHLGKSSVPTVIQLPDQEFEVDKIAVDANYFSTLDIELLEGRVFQENSQGDKTNIVINQQFVDQIFEEDPLGQTIKIADERFKVLGVVKDFHTYEFDREIKPTFFSLASPEEYKYLTLRVEDGKQAEAYQALQKSWSTLFPETPFQGGYQEDVWGMYFVEIDIHGKVWRGIAGIAIILAALGLYGQVTLNVSGRVREFSIRKVLGAGLSNLARSIAKQYLLLFGLALLIGAPLSYFLITLAFDMAYVYHMPVGLGGVTLAVTLLVGILLMVVASQLSRVAKTNPVQGLKVE